MRSLTLILALLGLTLAADHDLEIAAGIDDQAKAAYFVLSSEGYVFALNVAENGDVFYHMNAPASHSWMGVGFGSSMENVRMLISYIGEDGHTLINSCRMSTGHTEPEWEEDCRIDNVYTDKYAPFSNTLSPDGIMIAHAVCRNCSSWATGSIDIKNQQQPFIYALGPNETLHSNHPNANLRQHSVYGTFNLDMTVATNYTGTYGRVPAPQDPGLQVGDSFWAFANYFSSTAYNTGTLDEWAPVAHAVFMCLAFLLIFPLGAISLRLTRRATFHAFAQMIGTAFVIIGLGLGVYASKLYNKSKNFNSAHQVIGLIIFAALFLQIGLGLSHHLIFMRSGVPTIMGKIHRFFGISIIILALINGGLGFNFAQDDHDNVPYGIVVAVMAVIFGVLTFFVWSYSRKHLYKPEKEGFAQNYGDEPPAEYEMQGGTYVQTPRTPFFPGTLKSDPHDPEDFRSHLIRSQTGGKESLYTDTPASDRENPFKGKWEAVPLR
ncbi:iron reductase domain protein [Zasmidium cellare ATCC 36951]|uniref:Iron reductase domain protein n=1 Tax=Zasmidium cellare ATCC 36951 TaxID=1080233 RepID=A0A6A6CWI1_ZASCE|nr:iron reductase domain protein [Zasmidium cellare ATCC 36951]KAF2171375.1 iron reductase domain protein [Zasmidium cellare ATCC 36951]